MSKLRKISIYLIFIISAIAQLNPSTISSGGTGPQTNSQFDQGQSVIKTVQQAPYDPSSNRPPPGSFKWAASNSAWDALTTLGGRCCDNCNTICGFAIYRHGTGDVLTNHNSYFSFDRTTGPNQNQIFTLSQNADCTWSISNKGQYVSLFNTQYKEPWVGLNSRITRSQRWHLTRNSINTATYVESAHFIQHYWRTTASAPYYLATANGVASKFSFIFYPCDKLFGWSS